MGDFNYQPPSTGGLIPGFLDLWDSHRSRLDPTSNLGLLQRLGGSKVGDAVEIPKGVFFLCLKVKSGVMFFFFLG